MAKSKKALKALKRRNQARERSRALKSRQDYTGGGRVKAQVGGLPDGVQEAIDAARKAEELARTRATQSTQKTETPGQGGQSDIVPTTRPRPTSTPRSRPGVTGVIDSGAGTGVQLPTSPVPSDIRTTPQTPTPGVTGVGQPGVGKGIELPKKEEPEQQVLNFGTRYDGKEFTPGNYERISRDGGDPNQDKFITNDEWVNWMLGKGPDKGVSAQGIPFETIWKEKLIEAGKQGALTNATREKLNQRLGVGTVTTTETDADVGQQTTVAAQQAAAEAAEADEEAAEEDEEDYPSFEGPYEDVFPRPQPGDFGTNQAYQSALSFWTEGEELWNSLDAMGRLQQFASDLTEDQITYYNQFYGQNKESSRGTEENPRKLPYRIPGLSRDKATVEKADIATVATEDDPATTDIDEGTTSEAFKVERFERDTDGNLVLDPEGNPIRDSDAIRQVDKLVTVDDPLTDVDERAVAVADINVDKVKAAERQLTDPTQVKTNAKLLGVNEKATRGFLAAEANYFNKYPEVRNAIKRGEATDIFDYQRRIGEDLGYTLDFDTTEFAKSPEESITLIQNLAEASKAAFEQTEAAERDAEQEEAALATEPNFIEDPRSQIGRVEGVTTDLSPTREAEKQTREAILDEVPAVGTEAIINSHLGYEAAEKRAVKGEAAKGYAVSFLKEIISIPGQYGVDPVPPDIAEAILDDPAKVTAQIDTEPVEVQAAIAALPNEALVSVQLESLLAGIDEGVTPTWARPAVLLVESRLNARGLNVSTVARDALFNAIIQTSLPIAQSNAAALQQRANQNLSNEQQANLQESSQEMQLRLTNLANRQDAGSQTAQLAQQINLTQGQFTQQVQMTEAEQRQQVRIQSLQNEQQAAMANLGNDQQIELANLQIEAERLGANQSATNQERLAEFQVAANFLEKNAGFKQQMEVANLSNDQQMRLAFLTAKNQAESENLTTAQQTELANLSNRLEVNKISANLAQQMNLAQLNVDQQRAVQNAATVANIDLTKFNSSQQIELTNSKFMQTSTLQDLNNRQQAIMQDATSLASMSLQEADSLTKVSIENARNFLQMDMTNLNNEQQAYMLDSQQKQQRMLSDAAVQNATRQFNSSSDLQTQQFVTSLAANLSQFNSQQVNALEQFNSAETNRVAAINAGNELQAEQFLSQINTQISQFNSQQDLQVEQFNTANAQAVEQSNIEWRRKVNLADTAATNAANQQQAAFQFDMNKTALSQAWQSLRDQANFDFQEYQTNQERKISAINAILGNEAFMTQDKHNTKRDSFFNMLNKFSVSIKDFRDIGFVELADEVAEETIDEEETTGEEG